MVLNPLLFATDELHPKVVTLADGSRETFYFKELKASQISKYRAYYNQEDSNRELAMAYLVSAALCDADGKMAITLEQAGNLKAGISDNFVNIILKMSGFGVETGN